ncbi:MAG: ECF transporter S component [Eubacteriales bacterium]|jgi:riboflavin transporter FmnP
MENVAQNTQQTTPQNAQRTIRRAEARRTLTGRYIAVTGILSAIAFVLQLIEIPAVLMPSFIKFDFSDLPALISAFALGPVSGILVELIKNLLHTLVSGSFAVGELSNFLLGAVFTGVAGTIYKVNKTKKGAVIASLVGAACMAVASYPFNAFIVYPVYYNFMPKETILAAYQAILPSMTSVEQSLLVFNMPFTFIKGMIDVLLTFLIYPHISPLLHGRNR